MLRGQCKQGGDAECCVRVIKRAKVMDAAEGQEEVRGEEKGRTSSFTGAGRQGKRKRGRPRPQVCGRHECSSELVDRFQPEQ